MEQYDEHDDEPGFDKEELKALGLPRNERDYLIPAKDPKGASARLQCRVAPEIVRLIADIQASHKFPFRVQGDVIRYCVVTQARRLAASAGIPSVIAQGDAIMELLRDEEYQLQFEENFKAMKRVVDKYIDRRAPQKARELLTRIRTHIGNMPGQYWREQYEAELLDKYGKLLEGDVARADQPSLFLQSHTPDESH